MRSLFILLALVPLGCIDPVIDSKCDGTIIEVNPSYTTNADGSISNNPCLVNTSTGYDASACCPEGYEVLGMGESGLVLCEEVCDEDADAVTRADNAVYVVSALADAYLAAVEDLNTPPNP